MAGENWDDLRVFLDVARRENLSAAAKSLRIDPATAGRRIARLEQALGAGLFRKSPQGYALTEAGQRLLGRAEQMERLLRGAGQEVVELSDTLSGQIRIGAPDGCATFLLPQVCQTIAADHPDLDIQIVALPRVFNLSKREADMAITVSPPQAGRLTVRKLCNYQLHLVGAERYLSRFGIPQNLADLKMHKVIGYIPDLIFDSELDYLAELDAEHVDFASNSVSVQLAWARAEAGLAVAHDFALPGAPELRKVLDDQISLTRSFYLVRHADDANDMRLTRFADALTALIPPELSRLEALT